MAPLWIRISAWVSFQGERIPLVIDILLRCGRRCRRAAMQSKLVSLVLAPNIPKNRTRYEKG
jgi:hypothetical protein